MRGHIRQRGKDSWAIILDMGRDAAGKRQQRWITVHGKKKDAERELSRLLHEINTGAYVEPSRLTVREYLERWLKDYAKTNVSGKTYERYEEIVRLHLSPALGQHQLDKLKPLHIQAHYSKAVESGRTDGKGGLSAQTVLHHHRILHKALQQAVQWQLLARNPADAVEPPRPRRREMVALTEADTARLLKAAEGSRSYALVQVSVTTGLRRGELLGLRWQDIDFPNRRLSVRQSLEQTKARLAFKEPKTPKSRRSISLLPLTVECLRKVRTAQAEERLALGPAYVDHDLVFCQPDGQPLEPRKVSKAFAALVSKAGLGKLRLHDLRHTHATQLLRHGIHPKVVSERLGHTSVTITLDVYSHVLPDMQEEAADILEGALRPAFEGKPTERPGLVREHRGLYVAS